MVEPSAKQLVDAIIAVFPDHARGRRPIHTNGISALGHFEASKIARDYCIAAHFQGRRIRTTVRFSNGSGSPERHDGWSDVRGMATRFFLDYDAPTDLIAMTLREFFSGTPDDFVEFCKWSKMAPVPWESPWARIVGMLQLKSPLPDLMPGQTESGAAGALAYANCHRQAQPAVLDAGSIGAPVSYARATYNAVHTFVITAPNGTRRYVRFMWQPILGTRVTDTAGSPVDLQGDLRARLQKWPLQFLLLMMIGEIGDALDDPTIPWPPKRGRVAMGTLTLTEVATNQDADCEKISFNPCRLARGIDLSDDPILAARKGAYEVSRIQRGGTPCPFRYGAN